MLSYKNMQPNVSTSTESKISPAIVLEDIFSDEVLGKAKSVCRHMDVGGKFENESEIEKQKLIARFFRYHKIQIKNGFLFCIFLKIQFNLKPDVVTLNTLLNNSNSQLNQETLDLISQFIGKTEMTDKPNVVTLTSLIVNTVKIGDKIVKTKNVKDGLGYMFKAFSIYQKMLEEFDLKEEILLEDGRFANIFLGFLFRIISCDPKNKINIQTPLDLSLKLMNGGFFFKWKNTARDINTYMRTLIAFFNSPKIDDKIRYHDLNKMLMKIEFLFPDAKKLGIKTYAEHLSSLTDMSGNILDFAEVISSSLNGLNVQGSSDEIKIGNSSRTFTEGLTPVNGDAGRQISGKVLK